MDDFSSEKHAFLIMAHTNFSQLQTLIRLLDDPRNDIYLHVDKRAKTYRPDRIKVDYAGLVLIDRIRVNWGRTWSMTPCVPSTGRGEHPMSTGWRMFISSFPPIGCLPGNLTKIDPGAIERVVLHLLRGN